MKLPGVLGFLGSPAKSIAAVVDAVVDRLNDKYRLEFELKGSIRFVDLKPEDSLTKELK